MVDDIEANEANQIESSKPEKMNRDYLQTHFLPLLKIRLQLLGMLFARSFLETPGVFTVFNSTDESLPSFRNYFQAEKVTSNHKRKCFLLINELWHFCCMTFQSNLIYNGT